jgi:hypothetical protein
MFKRLAAGLLLKRVLRDLMRLADGLDQQNVLLARLADRFAPLDPVTVKAEVRADTGVSHLDVDEAFLAQEFVARTLRDTGHLPDEEEILIHLADERTLDLHARLVAREGELARLAEERA